MSDSTSVVVKIERDNGNGLLCSLYLADGRCEGPFHDSVVSLCDLYVGAMWSEELSTRIRFEEAVFAGREYALQYLSYAAHTTFEVLRHLVRKRGLPEDVAHKVIQWLEREHFLQDQALCERLIQQAISSGARESSLMLEQRLRRRGLPASMIRAALATADFAEFEGALHAAERKLPDIDRKLARAEARVQEKSSESNEENRNYWGADEADSSLSVAEKTKRRNLLASYLARKGYSRVTVEQVLSALEAAETE